jgi:hypothetical protein
MCELWGWLTKVHFGPHTYLRHEPGRVGLYQLLSTSQQGPDNISEIYSAITFTDQGDGQFATKQGFPVAMPSQQRQDFSSEAYLMP